MTDGGAPDGRMSKNERREAAREKARALREQQARKDRRNKVLIQGGVIALAAGVIALVAVLVVTLSASSAPGPGPRNMASDGIVIGQNLEAVSTPALEPGETPVPATQEPDADVVDIRVYVDYLCPFCAQFDLTNTEQMTQWLNDGAATLEIHPIAILTGQSAGTQYSLRAANAVACVANYAPDSFFAVHTALFENQPEEGTPGLTDEELKEIIAGAGAGSTEQINECVDERDYVDFVKDATERALSGPLPGTELPSVSATPTVLVDGRQYQGSITDSDAFAAFVLSAAGDAYSTPSPTATPQATSTPTPEPAPTAEPEPEPEPEPAT